LSGPCEHTGRPRRILRMRRAHLRSGEDMICRLGPAEQGSVARVIITAPLRLLRAADECVAPDGIVSRARWIVSAIWSSLFWRGAPLSRSGPRSPTSPAAPARSSTAAPRAHPGADLRRRPGCLYLYLRRGGLEPETAGLDRHACPRHRLFRRRCATDRVCRASSSKGVVSLLRALEELANRGSLSMRT
jgi:hypothetical protein